MPWKYCSDKQLRAAYQAECGCTERCEQGEGDQGVLFLFNVSAYIEALISTHSAINTISGGSNLYATQGKLLSIDPPSIKKLHSALTVCFIQTFGTTQILYIYNMSNYVKIKIYNYNNYQSELNRNQNKNENWIPMLFLTKKHKTKLTNHRYTHIYCKFQFS